MAPGGPVTAPLLAPALIVSSAGTDWRDCTLHNEDSGKKKEQAAALRKLVAALILCFVFMIVEVVGGYLAGSLAIMSDAAHLLSDVGGFAVSITALRMSQMKSPSHTFGFYRAEVLGALVSVLTIWMVTGVLVYEAVNRIITPRDVDGKLMFIIASLGVVVNLALFFVLGEAGHSHHGHSHSHHEHEHEQSHGHNHSHGNEHSHHSHSDEEDHHPHPCPHNHDHEGGHSHSSHSHSDADQSARAHGNGNMNVRSAFLHAVGDLLQNIGVMIAAALIWWRPQQMRLADPIATLLFSVLVVGTTQALVMDIVNVLMQRVPKGLRGEAIAEQISQVPGVQRVYDLHLWSLTSGIPILSVHVETAPGSERPAVLAAVEAVLRSEGLDHTTIQVH